MRITRFYRQTENGFRFSDGYDTFELTADRLKNYLLGCRTVRTGRNNIRFANPDGSTFLLPTSVYRCAVNSNTVSRTMDFVPKKVGIEFEFECPRSNVEQMVSALRSAVSFKDYRNSYGHWDATAWTLTHDSSLQDGSGFRGFELVSPPLNNGDFTQVQQVLRILNDYDCFVLKCCGTHVHFSWDFDVSSDRRVRMFDEYAKWEQFFDRLVSQSRRANNGRYCLSCRDHEYSNRYHKFNIAAHAKHGTLEVRQHQGTLSYSKVVHWISLMSAWFNYVNQPSYETPTCWDAQEILEKLGLESEWYLNRIVELGN